MSGNELEESGGELYAVEVSVKNHRIEPDGRTDKANPRYQGHIYLFLAIRYFIYKKYTIISPINDYKFHFQKPHQK